MALCIVVYGTGGILSLAPGFLGGTFYLVYCAGVRHALIAEGFADRLLYLDL